MATQETKPAKSKQVNMTIDGHQVTISFAQENNPTLAALVRNTLLDSFIRKNGLISDAEPANH